MPEINKKKSQADRAKAWRAAGLCSMCGQTSPVLGGKACEKCRAYHRAYRTELRNKGICKCGRLPVEGGRNCELCRANSRKHNRRYRDACITAYGGYVCACCGETNSEFLQIDHINNDGAAHRREVGTGNATYKWMMKNGFPPGFQVLCANCNYAKAHYGYCPHNREKELNSVPRQRKDDEPAATNAKRPARRAGRKDKDCEYWGRPGGWF